MGEITFRDYTLTLYTMGVYTVPEKRENEKSITREKAQDCEPREKRPPSCIGPDSKTRKSIRGNEKT